MAADLTLGDLRVYDHEKGVSIYYWVHDGTNVMGTLHTVFASIYEGQFDLGTCQRRVLPPKSGVIGEYEPVLMPSEMHHAIYAHYPKLMTYLMLKGKRHG